MMSLLLVDTNSMEYKAGELFVIVLLTAIVVMAVVRRRRRPKNVPPNQWGSPTPPARPTPDAHEPRGSMPAWEPPAGAGPTLPNEPE